MLVFFYNFILFCLALIMLPKTFYQYLRHGKYSDSFKSKFGGQFPKIEKGQKKLIWMHACSLGETKAIAAFAKLIKNNTDALIVISSTTETGHAEAKKGIPFADVHVYLPFDLSPIIAPIIKKASPDMIILSESEFWFNFLRISKNVGATIALVNGKISTRSAKRFQWFSLFSKNLFNLIDLFCVQNDLYADRFHSLGIDPQKIIVTGNLKFDESYIKMSESDMQNWKKELGISPKNRVLVIGSTHDTEEDLLLNSLEIVWKQFPELKVIVVPRHPERFPDVANLIKKKEIPYIRLSDFDNKSEEEKKIDKDLIEQAKVILIDKMGVLRKCYQISDIAIVGGSYTSKVGGHNIIEPCGYGVPVIFGPHMYTQTELVELVNQSDAGLQLEIEKVADTLIKWLEKPEIRDAIGEKGKKLVQSMSGGTQKTWEALKQIKKI